jgi:hypothetical protein
MSSDSQFDNAEKWVRIAMILFLLGWHMEIRLVLFLND